MSFQPEGGDADNEDNNKQEKEDKNEQKPSEDVKERVYYADWIRFMAISLVIFVHCLVNSFDASGLDPEEVP